MRRTALFVLAALVVMTSCHHAPLHDPLSGLYLNISVKTGPSVDLVPSVLEKASEASRQRIAGVTPDVMRVCLYDHESHMLVGEDYLPAEGGFVDVVPGTYDIIVYGSNSDVTRVSGTSALGQALSFTSEMGMSIRMSKNNPDGEDDHISFPIVYEPDHIFVGTAENVFIAPKADEKGITVVNIDAPTLLESYTFTAMNVQGIENITRLTCYITGQVPSRYLWDGHMPSEVCAIPVEVVADQSTGAIYAAFNTFVKHPRSFANVYLNVLVQNGGGSLFQWVYDVTSQFDDPDNVEHALVVTEEMNIPAVEAGGFSPSVNDWKAEIIIVQL